MLPAGSGDGTGSTPAGGDVTPGKSSADPATDGDASPARTAPLVVRRPVENDPDAVADRVLAWGRSCDPGEIPDGDAVHTLSAFLERPADRRAALVWYLEVDADAPSGGWADPVAAVRHRVEGDVGGLEDHLALAGDSRILGGGAGGSAAVLHEGTGARPAAVGTHRDRRPVVVSAGEGDPPDVVAVRTRVEAPLGEWFLRAFARVVTAFPEGGRFERRYRRATRPVLEEERMFTESILLEHAGGDCFLWWYMEAADMDRASEAYEASGDAFARLSDVLLGRILADPRDLFEPVERTRHEPLVHVVDPGRPGFGDG